MPTLRNGQVVLAKRENKYNRGDIVVIKDTSENIVLVKRIIFTPGDYYYYILDSQKFQMIFLLDNSFRSILEAKANYGDAVQEYKLGKDSYFVVGDNLNNSDDSRRFGPIKEDEIIYKVIK
jgi:signal peptidase I